MTEMIRHLTFIATLSLLLGSGCGGCGGETPPEENNTNNTTGCTPGEADCACTDDGACDDGLMCDDSMTCVGVAVTGLSVKNAQARSCEVMLTEGAGVRVLGATYGEGVDGALRRQSPRVALAFAVVGDAAFPASTLQLQADGDLSALTLGDIRCFDAAGAVLESPEVTLAQ